MNVFQNRFVLAVLRWILSSVFIYAGVTKLSSPQNFADSIATFAILPNSLVNLVALGLPPFEIIAGLAIITGIQRRPALLGLTALTVVFLIAVGSVILRGIPIDCGCFGSGKPTAAADWIALGRDVIIFAAGLLLYRREIATERARQTEFRESLAVTKA